MAETFPLQTWQYTSAAGILFRKWKHDTGRFHSTGLSRILLGVSKPLGWITATMTHVVKLASFAVKGAFRLYDLVTHIPWVGEYLRILIWVGVAGFWLNHGGYAFLRKWLGKAYAWWRNRAAVWGESILGKTLLQPAPAGVPLVGIPGIVRGSADWYAVFGGFP